MSADLFREWAVLELMGHRRLAGMVTEEEIGGSKFIRIDVPSREGPVTQFYSPSAIYCITPTVEAIAREIASHTTAAPITRFDIPNLLGSGGVRTGDDEDRDGV